MALLDWVSRVAIWAIQNAQYWSFVLCGWLPFCKYLFRAWQFVRSSLVFGLLARHTWPLALMVSTNQVPFRTSNSKRSGQSTGRLGFRTDNFPSLHLSCKKGAIHTIRIADPSTSLTNEFSTSAFRGRTRFSNVAALHQCAKCSL